MSVGARQPAVTFPKEQRAMTITLAHHRLLAKTSSKFGTNEW